MAAEAGRQGEDLLRQAQGQLGEQAAGGSSSWRIRCCRSARSSARWHAPPARAAWRPVLRAMPPRGPVLPGKCYRSASPARWPTKCSPSRAAGQRSSWSWRQERDWWPAGSPACLRARIAIRGPRPLASGGRWSVMTMRAVRKRRKQPARSAPAARPDSRRSVGDQFSDGPLALSQARSRVGQGQSGRRHRQGRNRQLGARPGESGTDSRRRYDRQPLVVDRQLLLDLADRAALDSFGMNARVGSRSHGASNQN